MGFFKSHAEKLAILKQKREKEAHKFQERTELNKVKKDIRNIRSSNQGGFSSGLKKFGVTAFKNMKENGPKIKFQPNPGAVLGSTSVKKKEIKTYRI